jgi:electron transport complex protein RnfB
MHTVIEAECTGCELCVPACPVDCIVLEELTPGRSGWDAWSPTQADAARERYQATQTRRARLGAEHRAAKLAEAETKLARLPELTKLPGQDAAADAAELARKKGVIEAALARARARRGG